MTAAFIDFWGKIKRFFVNTVAWEEPEREICRRCNGTGYIETQQGKFDI